MIRALFAAATMFALGLAGALILRQPGPDAELVAVGTGPAPGFQLTAQDGTIRTLADLRGKVVVLSFAFTRCGDICPVAIYKFTWMQDELGPAFGDQVHFVTITVDPGHDTVEVLADYADQIGADAKGWSFLTGSARQIRRVSRSYGVYSAPQTDGTVDHILLTSLIDRAGIIRVQYLGERFRAEEMLGDLRSLVAGRDLSG